MFTLNIEPEVAEATTKRTKVIIDTDVGYDDTRALILALKQETVHILAITTVYGNVAVDQAVANVRRICCLCDREDVRFFLDNIKFNFK